MAHVGLDSSAPHLASASTVGDLTDWGIIPTMIEGESHTSGVILHQGPDGESD